MLFNPIRSSPALRIFAHTNLILELHYCALGTFPPKNSLAPCGDFFFFDWGHDLAVRVVSKFKVDMIFIIFREFNMLL